MKYQPIFELRIQHAAYPGGRCGDLRIEPRAGHPTGQRALQRHRLLARSRPQGIEVVAAVDDGADVFASAFPGASELVFGFDLHITGSEFAAVTELESWANLHHPHYRGTTQGSLQLVGDAPALGFGPGVAALVEITGLSSESLTSPAVFTLELAARQVPWVYYLLTKRPPGDLPRLRDHAEQPLTFTGEQLILAETSASADPIGRRLLERHADHRCFRFVSEQPVALQRGVRRQLDLHLGDELLRSGVAVPTLHNFTLLTLEPDGPRQALYQVVEY